MKENHLERDLNRLENWAYVNFMKFKKAKFKVVFIPWYQYRQRDELLRVIMFSRKNWQYWPMKNKT